MKFIEQWLAGKISTKHLHFELTDGFTHLQELSDGYFAELEARYGY
ncbi:MAG: hypothetical protein NUW00_03575 [Candidatus Kaiserbacteria bacterium]|nr:hypothetical protein [Candidatus Kaiserbacteria bacterium]MCR4330420.1 hypothetical protein [Patescibacteria group bacterium]